MSEFTDRTRCETFDACPRKRWWATEWMRDQQVQTPDNQLVHVGGLSPSIPSVEPEIGSAIHRISSWLLDEAIEGRGLPEDDLARTMIRDGLADFRQEVSGGVRLAGNPLDAGREFKLKESAALVEGFGWLMRLKVLPILLERFDVLEAEREGRSRLTPDIVFLSRPDALLRERESGDLYCWSLKVIKEVWESDYQRDIQSMSECWSRSNDMDDPLPAPVVGVQMTYLLKGRSYENETLGCKVHSCPITRGYRQTDGLVENWAWSYDVPKIGKNGEAYTGKLGKGWGQAPTWEFAGGIEGWVRALVNGDIQPEAGDPLDRMVLMPQPYFRSDSDIRDWLEAAAEAEEHVVRWSEAANAVLRLEDYRAWESLLNRKFPKRTRECFRYTRNYPCSFLPLCEGAQARLDPLAAGFRLRNPNHPEEGEN